MTTNATRIRLDGVSGIDFYADKRYTLTTRTGWDSTPGLTGSNLTVPGRNGEIWRAKDYGPGRMVLEIYIHNVDATGVIPGGSNAEKQFRANLDRLLELFSRKTLIEVQKTENPADVSPVYKINYAEVGIVLNPVYDNGTEPGATLTVELVFPDPIWLDIVAVDTVGTPSATTPRTQVLSNLAGTTAPITDSIFVLIGPATNPRVADGYGTGWIQYNGTIAGGSRWRVNCLTFQSETGATLNYSAGSYINLNTGTNAIAQTSFSPGPNLLSITPGPGGVAPSVVLSGSGFSSATQLNVLARKKFIS